MHICNNNQGLVSKSVTEKVKNKKQEVTNKRREGNRFKLEYRKYEHERLGMAELLESGVSASWVCILI